MTESTTIALDKLNAYEGDNIWQDVIYGLDFDRDATEAADPNYHNDVVVLDSGETVRLSLTGEWCVS